MTSSPSNTTEPQPVADSAQDPVVTALADAAARRAWLCLQEFGAVRPGMAHDQPLGLWKAIGGVPMEVARAALLDSLSLRDDPDLLVRPEETARAVLARWITARLDDAWEEAVKLHHTA